MITGYIVGSGFLIRQLYAADARKAEAYYDAMGAAQTDVKFLAEFRRIFPGAVERVRYFSPGGEPGFEALVHLYSRYELTMKLPVIFDVSGKRVVGYGVPAFYLTEVQRVGKTPSGTVEISYDPVGELRFGPSEWTKLVEHDGDFASIGYKMTTDKPIPNFELFTITQ